MRFLDVLEFQDAIVDLLDLQPPKTVEEMARFSDDMHKSIETAISRHLANRIANERSTELPDVYDYRPYY